MAEFFDFVLWLLQSFVNFLLALPFMPEFTLGQGLIALAILGVLITALVTSIRAADLSGEARTFNAQDRMNKN